MQRVATMRRTPGRMYTYPPSNTCGFGFGQRHGDVHSTLGSDLPTLGSGNVLVFDGVGAFGLGASTVEPTLGSGVAFPMLPPLPSTTPPPSTVSSTLPVTTMTIPLPLPATTTYSNYNYTTYSTSTSHSAPATASTYQSAYQGAPPPTPGSAPTPGPGQQGYSSTTSTPAPGQGPGSSFSGHHAQHSSTPGPYGPPASTPTPQPGSGSYHHSYGSSSGSTGGPGVVPLQHHTHQPGSSSSTYHYTGYTPYSSQSQQSQGQGYGTGASSHTPASVPPPTSSSAGPSGSGAGGGVGSTSQRHASMSQTQPPGQGSGDSVYALDGYHHHNNQPIGHGRSASGVPTSSTPAPGGYQQSQSQSQAQPPTPAPGPQPGFPTYHMHQQHQQTLQSQSHAHSQNQGQSLINVPSGPGSSLASGVSHPLQNQGSTSSNSSIGHPVAPTSASAVNLPPPSKVVGMPVAVKDEHERETMLRECIPKIHENVKILYSFAEHYSKLQAKTPNIQPPEEEIQEMTRCANIIIQLIEQLKQLSFPDDSLPGSMVAPGMTTKKEIAGLALGLGFPANPGLSASASAGERPPKRPWEEVADDMQGSDYDYAPEKQVPGQTMAEKDMAIIRSKRATNGTGPAPGAPKGKYRKRSRASPPGKCHSCNIKETPEWRRGPDGARTLCNACGLHYAKLIRKRDKVIQSSGQAPPKVDLETLRAATRAAEKDNPNRHRTQIAQASTSQLQQGDMTREDSVSASGSAGVNRQLSQSSLPPQHSPTMVAHYFSDNEMGVPTSTHPPSHSQQSPTMMPPPPSSSWTTLPPAQPRAYAAPEASSFARASHARSSAN